MSRFARTIRQHARWLAANAQQRNRADYRSLSQMRRRPCCNDTCTRRTVRKSPAVRGCAARRRARAARRRAGGCASRLFLVLTQGEAVVRRMRGRWLSVTVACFLRTSRTKRARFLLFRSQLFSSFTARCLRDFRNVLLLRGICQCRLPHSWPCRVRGRRLGAPFECSHIALLRRNQTLAHWSFLFRQRR